jgi:SAM-dependent methyltransferase
LDHRFAIIGFVLIGVAATAMAACLPLNEGQGRFFDGPDQAEPVKPGRSVLTLGKRAFMRFWYGYVRKLNIWLPTIRLDGKTLVISPEVYKPLENEQGCVAYALAEDRVLDLGCGSGVNTVFVAPHVREVVAVDIAAAAVANTEENCRRQGLTNVTARRSDMFSGVDGKFDLILANPPYISEDFEGDEAQFATSIRFVPTLFREAPQRLAPGGRLLVQFPMWYRKRLEKAAAQNGLELVSVRRARLKGPGLFLLSLLYMQVGWRSAFFLWRVRSPVGQMAGEDGRAEELQPAA